MKDERIDRERLFGPVQQAVHDRLEATLQTIGEDEPVKKMRFQPLLVALIIVLLCGVAIAAVTNWGVREAMTYTDVAGNEVVNEALVELAQPIGTVFDGEALRVEVTEGLFDGRTVIAAWTVTNKTEERLYLLAEPTEDSVDWNSGGGSFGVDREFIEPGETLGGMMSRVLMYDVPTEGTMHVGVYYDALRPTDKIAPLDYPVLGEDVGENYVQFEDAEARMAAYEAQVQALVDEGKVPLITFEGGYVGFHDSFYAGELQKAYEALEASGVERYSEADALIGTGAFERVEKLAFGYDLQAEMGSVRSLLPEGEPLEKDYGEFVMRISKADVTLNTVEIIVDAIYPDEETAKAYFFPGEDTPQISFIALNEEGKMHWGSSSGWGMYSGEIVPLEDGRWMAQHNINHDGLVTMPKRIEVCPRVATMSMAGWEEGNGGWQLTALPGQEEGIVLEID